LANKGPFGRDGAAIWMAGWGFQVALYSPDSLEKHIEDSIRGGKYLNNQKLVKTFLSLAPRALSDISKWGVRLAREGEKYLQARLPGEAYARSIYHVHFGKMLGADYRRALPRQVRKRKKINVIEDLFIFDLLKNGNEVVGAIGLNIATGTPVVINAKATILATGGYMGCYTFTTANSTATGDGHGAALRAGVRMTGMEFIQFIPTQTLWPQIVYGDLYTYGMLNAIYGMFFNRMGERFMERYYPKEKDWATREAASRAIAREVREGRGSPHGGAFLSFKHIPKNIMDSFLEANKESSFLQNLEKTGFNIREEALEVGPGAHYVQGGCWIDEKCKTNLERFYAIGELGSGGKDGADRLPGNSLPYCMAMGYIAGKDAAEVVQSSNMPKPDNDQVEMLIQKMQAPLDRKEGTNPQEIKDKVRQILRKSAIFHRNEEQLNEGLKEIENIRDNMLPKVFTQTKSKTYNQEWMAALEAENMVDVTEMLLKSALMREESRGLHEREDFPEVDPDWMKHIIIQRAGDEMSFSTEPVTFPYVKPE
ncbi:MAG: FAD-binding protein, partial [Thermodesulfobacteriota bacterium]|nr:FAD-binding protein [Thermodesulfobacteriota bacterium]